MRPSTLITTLSLTPPALSSTPQQCAPATSQSLNDRNPQTCLTTTPLPNPSTWHPWTHPPYCTTASSLASPYCVYTHAAACLSVITTPDDASTTFHSLIAANPDPENKPFFAPEKVIHPRPYAVVDIPGKGKGAVATARIKKGMAVLVDHASVLARVEYPPGVRVGELLDVAVGRLGDPGRVWRLSKRGGREVGVSEVEDLVLTNSVAVGVGEEGYMGLFADLARLNHACKPNAFIHFSQSTLTMTVWSARDIEPGEEITITYSAAGLVSTERQETLEKVWGFKCTCSLCTAPPEQIKASDANREQIRLLQDRVVELAQGGRLRKAVETAEHMFSLIEEEGMTEQMGGMYEIPARLYYKLGNFEKALEYTSKARLEIDGYGPAGEKGEKKIQMLEAAMRQMREKIRGRKTNKKAD